MSQHTIGCSSGITLVFPTGEEFSAYQAKLHILQMEAYGEIRAKHGIWAGNQNKFVASREDMNHMDPTTMEDKYSAYLRTLERNNNET